MKEDIRDIADQVKSKELRTTVERHAVRAVTLQMRPIEEFMHDLMPPDEIILNGMPHYEFPELTTCILEVKNDKAVNKHQVMLPGGKVRGKQKDNPSEYDIYDSINEKIWEELHLNPTNIEPLPVPVRRVQFKHPRLFGRNKPGTLVNHEHYTVATVAPFDRNIKVFNPRDNIQSVLRLVPSELFHLLEYEEYTLPDQTVVTLLDSLRTDSEMRDKYETKISDDPLLYKEAIYEQSVLYEARIVQAVVHQLMRTTNVNKTGQLEEEIRIFDALPVPSTLEDAVMVNKQARSVAQLIVYSYDKSSFHTLSYRYTPREKLAQFQKQDVLGSVKQWEHFAQEFTRAYNLVALQQTIELTVKTGPQQAYILAQIIPRLEQLGPSEYEIFSQNPMIKHILDVPLRVFEIDPTKKNWLSTLRAKLMRVQSWQYSKDPSARKRFATIAGNIDYAFCHPRDRRIATIGDPRKIGIHSENANSFKRHLRDEIAPFATDEVAFAIASNQWGSDAHGTFELIYRAFGINQYNATKPTIPYSEQNAAWTKLLLELTDKEVLDIWTDATNVSIKPIRGAYDALFDEPLVKGIIIHKSAYPRYVMDAALQRTYTSLARQDEIFNKGGHLIDFGKIPIYVVSNIRVKSLLELKRKWLERTNRRSDGTVDLTDFFGYFIALDDEQFLTDLYTAYPDLHHPMRKNMAQKILIQWKRYATKTIVYGMEDIITHSTHEIPVISRDKGKITASYLEEIVSVSKHEGGSAASKETWEWMKYVLHVTFSDRVLEVEQQVFPDLQSLRAKIQDDEVFHIRRLFDKPTNRYPIMWVMFAAQEGYEEMIRLHNEARYASSEQSKLIRWLGAMLMNMYLRLHIQEESVIYQRDHES